MTLAMISSVREELEKQNLVKSARLYALLTDLCFDRHIAF